MVGFGTEANDEQAYRLNHIDNVAFAKVTKQPNKVEYGLIISRTAAGVSTSGG